MSTPQIPAGTWTIDASHSEVGFTVRHLMVAKVRGTFEKFSGTITIGENPLDSSVEAEIDLNSVNTRDEQRDAHLRSADFFDVESKGNMTFKSTLVKQDGDDYLVLGDLTIKGTTRPVELKLEFNGTHPDPWGGTRAGFSAETEISRKDFGVDFEVPMDGPGVVVGDKIKVQLEVEGVLQA
jgi:polyisoprenoid-binding protein YceI